MSKAKELEEVLIECLFKSQEEVDELKAAGKEPIIIEGVVLRMGFHPERLEARREYVKTFIKEMVAEVFFKGSGDGMSFGALPFDKHGQHWGEHKHADILNVLAQGLGYAKYCLPREMWPMLGGLPYIVFDIGQ